MIDRMKETKTRKWKVKELLDLLDPKKLKKKTRKIYRSHLFKTVWSIHALKLVLFRLSYKFYNDYIVSSRVSFECLLLFIHEILNQNNSPRLILLDMSLAAFLKTLKDAKLHTSDEYKILLKTPQLSGQMLHHI